MSYSAQLALGTVRAAMATADERVEALRAHRDKRHHVAHVRAAVVSVLYREHPIPQDRQQIRSALQAMKLRITRQGLDRHLVELTAANVVMEYGRVRVREARGGYAPMTFVLHPEFLDRVTP